MGSWDQILIPIHFLGILGKAEEKNQVQITYDYWITKEDMYNALSIQSCDFPYSLERSLYPDVRVYGSPLTKIQSEDARGGASNKGKE